MISRFIFDLFCFLLSELLFRPCKNFVFYDFNLAPEMFFLMSLLRFNWLS